MVRVFTYPAALAGSPEEIAEEAFAICNDHPRDASGHELARRYHQPELRSLSFRGNSPCCRSCCLDVGGAAGRGPAWIPTATAIMTVGGLRRSWRRMPTGFLARCPAAEPEEVPLGGGRCHAGRTLVGGRGLAVAAEPVKQVGSGGVEEVVVVQVQLVH